jgi:MFS family permease
MKISTFESFHNRNFRLFFSGQSISQIGTWMQRTSVAWLIYTMTHSAYMLGLTAFLSQFPSFLLSIIGGIAADRYNRYRMLLLTQTVSMVQAAILAALVLIKHYTVLDILVLSVILGIINAFDVPARQPIINEIITDKEDLPNAIALNSSMVNIARLVGPALSGIILLKFGAGYCFLINALSFVAVITSLLLMKLPAHVPQTIKKKLGEELAEGFNYLKNTPSLNRVILLLGSVSLMVLPYNTLVPIFAKIIFKGNAATYGYINAFIGLGALSGSVLLASLKKKANLKLALFWNSIVFGVSLILFSKISYFPLAMLFATFIGLGMMSQLTIAITIIQVESGKKMIGRITSYVAMAYFGMLPIGSLAVGMVSQRIGAPNTIFFQGVIALVIVAAFSKFLLKGGTDERKLSAIQENPETAKIRSSN